MDFHEAWCCWDLLKLSSHSSFGWSWTADMDNLRDVHEFLRMCSWGIPSHSLCDIAGNPRDDIQQGMNQTLLPTQRLLTPRNSDVTLRLLGRSETLFDWKTASHHYLHSSLTNWKSWVNNRANTPELLCYISPAFPDVCFFNTNEVTVCVCVYL